MHKIYYIVIIVLVVFSYGFAFFINRIKSKKHESEFLDDPNAIKVNLDNKEYLIYSRRITVNSVNDEVPKFFTKGIFTSGFYTKAGKNKIVLRYESERPGFFSRKVITYTDFVPVEVELKKGVEYLVTFDTNEEKFIFNEVKYK